MTVVSEKKSFRQKLLSKRKAYTPDDRQARSVELLKHVLTHLDSVAQPLSTVGMFYPIGDEVDMTPLYTPLSEQGVQVALPRAIEKGKPLRFQVWDGTPPTDTDAYNIPCASGEDVQPPVILVPLLGFDRNGARLGYGAGFYDLTFAHMPPDVLKIGIAMSFQEVEKIPTEEHDVPLDWVVTERELIKC